MSDAQPPILTFCDYFGQPMIGGIERVTLETLSRLPSGTALVLVTGVDPSSDPVQTEFEQVRCRALDFSRVLGAQVSFAPALPWRAWRAARRHHPSVVHVAGVHFFGSVAGAALATICRVPLVASCHLAGTDHLSGWLRWVTRTYEKTIGRVLLRRCARVIAVGATVEREVLALGVNPDRVVVVPNGVDTDRFAPGTNVSGEVVIAVVGRMIANKGTLETADALAELNSDGVVGAFEAVFAGAGPLAAEIDRRAAEANWLTHLGPVSDPETVLHRADICVRYSTTEGRSLSILEAMASGCAVVASDIDANRELITDGANGLLVALGDRAALVAAIARLIEDPALRQHLGAAARMYAEQFSWEATATATHNVLVAAADG